MTGLLRTAALGAFVLSLAGCVSAPPRTALPEATTPQQIAQGQAWQRDRAARLQGPSPWELTGRIAVSAGGKGGSGRIDWRQEGPRFDIALGAPVTRQSWRLIGDDSGARLEGLEGGAREGRDAQVLLAEATGWRIPIASLPDWARGLRSADDASPGKETYGSNGHLLRISQAGWVIEYPEWYPETAGRPAMPKRIFAHSGDASVRLVIDGWGGGAGNESTAR